MLHIWEKDTGGLEAYLGLLYLLGWGLAKHPGWMAPNTSQWLKVWAPEQPGGVKSQLCLFWGTMARWLDLLKASFPHT